MAGLDNVVVVCGPTATGKSALALELCRRFGGEIVTADSMQIYKGLVVGTAAIKPEEAGGVPQHLLGFLPPEETFSVAQWARMAEATVADIGAQGALPVLCGGTGLYINSFVNGIDFTATEPGRKAETLRIELEQDWENAGAQAVYARLKQCDPQRAEQLHINDKKRVIRALEQVLATGLTARARDEQSRSAGVKHRAVCIGLYFENREELYRRCNTRVDQMMETGLLGEAEMVWKNAARYRTAAQAIGYKELFPYFEGKAPLDGCVDKLKQATRNYAKRQITWFGKVPQVQWLQADDTHLAEKAEALVKNGLQELMRNG